jgi:hypothetical protein
LLQDNDMRADGVELFQSSPHTHIVLSAIPFPSHTSRVGYDII